MLIYFSLTATMRINYITAIKANISGRGQTNP